MKQPESGRERPAGDTVHDGTPQVAALADAKAQDNRQGQPARPVRPAQGPALADVPVAYDKRERGHGRTQRRILKVTSVAKGLAFPHAMQATQIVRRRKLKQKWSRETCYAVTSVRTASSPHIMASLRNLAITILRLTGHASIATALRYHARRPGRPLQTIMHS